MAWVYLLRCRDGSYYVGSTTHLEARLHEHRSGRGAAYTRRRLPVELVFAQECEQVAEAFALEKRYQGWSRAKREALVRGDFVALPALSRGRRAHPPPTPGVRSERPHAAPGV